MTDLGTTFTQAPHPSLPTVFSTEALLITRSQHVDNIHEVVTCTTHTAVPLGFTTGQMTSAVTEAVRHALVEHKAQASNETPTPSRACHGCLVDGLVHNCGYTGF